MSRRSRSRLTSIERNRTIKAIVWALLLVAVLGVTLFTYGIPLLIHMAVFISSLKETKTVESTEKQTLIAAPILDALPDATPSATIAVTGFSLTDTSITIVVNGEEHDPTTPTDSGSFSIPVSLSEGNNVIFAIAKDDRGNASSPSRHWTVIRDSTPPMLTIDKPEHGTDRKEKSERTVEVKGKTERDASLTVNGRFVSVEDDGEFSMIFELREGENALEVVASDRAGNKTTERATVTWTP